MDKVSRVTTRQAPIWGDGWCLAIGFSARALAEALRDAGLRVIAVDAFCDKDLKESAKVPQILSSWGAPGLEKTLQTDRWNCYRELPNCTQTAPPLPVFLAGGCENWQELLLFLDAQPGLRLLGPGPSEIKKLRDPKVWQQACIGSGIEFPTSVFAQTAVSPWGGLAQTDSQTAVSPCSFRTDAQTAVSPCSLRPATLDSPLIATDRSTIASGWLVKKTSSGGGLGVQSAASPESVLADDGYYLQAFIPGRCLGASFLVQSVDDSRTNVQLVGVTESWKSCDWPADGEFIYRGSFGPIELTAIQQNAAQRLVQELLKQCDLAHHENLSTSTVGSSDATTQSPRRWSGYLQIDLIERQDGQLFLLEVNPRWTAGMEILRLSGQVNMAALQARANGIDLDQDNTQPRTPQRWVGKAIYYAPQQLLLDQNILGKLHSLSGRGFSDIPSGDMLGQHIEQGHPVLTITASLHRQGPVETQAESQSLNTESSARQRVLEELKIKRQQLEELLGLTASV